MSRGFAIFNFPVYGESSLPAPGVEGLWIWDDGSTHIWDDGSVAVWDVGVPAMPDYELEMQWEDGELIEWEDGSLMYWEPHSGEVDATPDQFAFTTISGALTGTLYTSNSITIAGVSSTVPFNGVEEPIGIVAEVDGAEWSLNGGPWTAAEGSVYLGDVVRLRMTSSASADTPVVGGFTAGGTSATWTVRTAPDAIDTTPDAFSFTDVASAPISTLHVSNYVTVAGINAPTPLEVVGEAVEFSISDGAWTAGVQTPGTGPSITVVNGDTLRLRMTSRGSYDASITATPTIGGVSDTWTVTTEAAPVPDTTPDAFTFTDVTDASVSTVYISNSITVTGINAPAAITITDGEYSINSGAWTSAAGNVNLGQQVRVRHTSSAAFSTSVNTILSIGGVADVFTTTTAADPGSDATTPLASPGWLVEAEDYTETKLGAAYSSTTYQTIFQWDIDGVGTVSTVNNTTEMVSAINAAKSNATIKGVHLNPGNYTWPKDLLDGLSRTNDDAFFIRTTPGAQSQAVVSKIQEESGNFSGIAFVDLNVSGGGLWLQGPFGGSPAATHDVLIERCHGWIVIQGQNMGSLTPGQAANNVQIRLNTLVDHWGAPGNNLTHGLYTWNTDWVLLEGNIFDHNGWDPAGTRATSATVGGPTSQKHNAYLNRPAVPEHYIIRFNWNSRSAANGFHLKGGGTAYRNIMSCNPIHMSPGYGGDGNFAAYGLVDGSTVRDNLFINVDNISTSVPMGIFVWLTCIDNALVDSNYMVYDNGTLVNSAAVCRENNYPITATVSNNVAYSIHVPYIDRGSGNTPSITDTGNTWDAASISAPAEALAFQLGAEPTGDTANPVHASVHAWIDNFKTSRRRLGVDIEQLKTWMSTIIGGITP